MKTLKTILLGLTLLVASTVANAKSIQTATLTKNDVLNAYVNAVIHGKTEGVENILAKDFKYVMYRNDKEFNLNKTQMIESLKASENVEQACTFTTSVVDETTDKMVVKLIMRYDGYVRTNEITISKKHDDFQITRIQTES
ncbi:hypothetical protein ACFS5N_13700 [Mucilaginibacter ximonensis]|uniref:Lumazine-binding protein n=1 Tax=Mucilaginibacter ximonensis TaxID=538021 RepID=A0ABW5YEA0_9SPHI